MPPATLEQAGAWRPRRVRMTQEEATALFYSTQDLITGKVMKIPEGIDRQKDATDAPSVEDDGLGLYDALSMGGTDESEA